MGLSEVLIGIFTAAFLMFLRSANLLAQRQKSAAVQLNSYLQYWKRLVFDNDWFSVFHAGVKWNKDAKELIEKGGGAEELVKLEESKKAIVDELREALETESSDFEEAASEFRKIIKNTPPKILDDLMSFTLTSNQNLIEGKTFISDEDASHFHAYIASVCIDLKMKIVNVMTSLVALVIRISADPDSFEIKDQSKEISELIWQAILISKDIDLLSTGIEKYVKKSIFELTIDNVGL